MIRTVLVGAKAQADGPLQHGQQLGAGAEQFLTLCQPGRLALSQGEQRLVQQPDELEPRVQGRSGLRLQTK